MTNGLLNFFELIPASLIKVAQVQILSGSTHGFCRTSSVTADPDGTRRAIRGRPVGASRGFGDRASWGCYLLYDSVFILSSQLPLLRGELPRLG